MKPEEGLSYQLRNPDFVLCGQLRHRQPAHQRSLSAHLLLAQKNTLVNVYVDLLVFTRITGTS